MTVTINGTTGITSTGAYSSDGISFADNTPADTLVTNTSGYVGVGIASPVRKLQVHEATAATNAYFQLSNATTGSGTTDGFQLIVGTGGETILAQRENAEIQFWTNNTEQMRLTGAGNLQFNSGYGSVATAYGCRAWVNFNGTGTVAIRASGNVSSITDNGTGDYTVNFSTAMPDTNYATIMYNNANSATDDAGQFSNNYVGGIGSTTTTSIRVTSYGSNYADSGKFNVAIFR